MRTGQLELLEVCLIDRMTPFQQFMFERSELFVEGCIDITRGFTILPAVEAASSAQSLLFGCIRYRSIVEIAVTLASPG